MTVNKIVVRQTERELTMSRVFNAPRSLVWQAFTTPEHLKHWWGPKGCVTTIYQMDVRPSGIWHYSIRAPSGDEHQIRAVYKEVVKPERIVYDQTFIGADGQNEPGPAHAGSVTVTLKEAGQQTKLTSHVSFQSASDFDALKAIGTIRGTELTWDRLEGYLTDIKGEKL